MADKLSDMDSENQKMVEAIDSGNQGIRNAIEKVNSIDLSVKGASDVSERIIREASGAGP